VGYERIIPKTTKYVYALLNLRDVSGFPVGVYSSHRRAKDKATEVFGVSPKSWVHRHVGGDTRWFGPDPTEGVELQIVRYSVNDVGF
jgi:hypothetical protein